MGAQGTGAEKEGLWSALPCRAFHSDAETQGARPGGAWLRCISEITQGSWGVSLGLGRDRVVAVPFQWLVYLMARYERGPSQSGYPKGALGPVVGLRARSTGGVWRTGLLLGVWASGDLYKSPLSAVFLLQPHVSHRRGQGQRPSEEGRGP